MINNQNVPARQSEIRQQAIAHKNSIRTRLQKTFFLLIVLTINTMAAFSLIYFYFSTKKEAEHLAQNKVQLAQVFLDKKKSETAKFANLLAQDRALQIGIDLDNPERISEYLFKVLDNNKGYYVSVYSGDGNVISDVGKTGSPIFTNRKNLSVSEKMLLQDSLNGNTVTDVIYVTNGLQEKYPAFASAVPIYNNNVVIGVVFVRFVFVDNTDFFTNLAKNIESELSFYVDTEAQINTSNLAITPEQYNNVTNLKTNYEEISLTGSGLNEYRGIFSNGGNAVGVLHIYLSSLPYLKTFTTAIVVYIFLGIFLSFIVGYSIFKLSATIINPLDTLLQSVNIVREGNLGHEINLSVKDEIGRLGTAFNEMRAQLNEKMSTIENMNSSLEKTIEERTETINTLNEKMKHYLSPQLYASIAGGKRDSSISLHYRKKLTVFFSDVVNFTSTTDSLEPEDASALLNDYLDAMAKIALEFEGTIDKYVGDAIMVFFGDPEFISDKDHALRAVKMAMAMQQNLIRFREKWHKKGIKDPFHVRMGVNTGYCTIGNFGSETKMDYTIIGNSVNLAARYEAASKPDSILISQETYTFVKDEIECIEAGSYTLKGIPHPVKGYTPIKNITAEKKPEYIKVTNNKEIIFANDTIDVKKMNAVEKHALLLNMKRVYETVTGKDDSKR